MTVSQAGNFNIQEFSDAGLPLAVGRLYTYAFGTTTFKAAYTDAAGSVQQTYTSDGAGGLYIALNSRGELPAPLYLLTDGPYDITLKRADGSTVWTRRAQGQTGSSDLSGSGGSALVGFQDVGAGAVPLTVEKLLRLTLYPQKFGAVGDGVTDDGAALNRVIDRMRTLINAAPNGEIAVSIEGAGLAYATSISINATGLLTGWEIKNMAIVGKCTGKAVLDTIGSRSGSLRRILVYGDPSNMPSVGVQTARSSNPSFGACDGHHWQQVYTRGKFSTAGVHLYGQEGTVYERCQFWNSQNTAYMGIHVGSSLVAMSSDYLAPMTGPTSYVDDVYINCDWLYLPDATNSCAITGISKANPAVVTCASHPFTNGQVVNVGAVLGMTEINNLVGTVSSATSTTFALTGINSTAFSTYTSGGLVALSQTKPNILFGRAAQHKFINCYAPNYGSNNIQIDFADGQPMCDIDMDFLFEGQGTSSHVQFANVGTILGWHFKTYNTCARDWIISTLAGAGTIFLLGDGKIVQPSAVSGTNPALFDTAARYNVNGAKVVVPTSSSFTPTTLGQNFKGTITDVGAGTTTAVNMLVADSRDGAMTPVISSGSGTFTSANSTGNFRRNGKFLWWNLVIHITTNGTAATSVIAVMPFTAAFDQPFPGVITANGKAVTGLMTGGGTALTVRLADGTYPGADGLFIELGGVLLEA